MESKEVQFVDKDIELTICWLKGEVMDEEQKVMEWITSELEPKTYTLQDYPVYRSGKRIIDRSGDYLIVYFHPLLKKVVYTFKGIEDHYFIAHNYC